MTGNGKAFNHACQSLGQSDREHLCLFAGQENQREAEHICSPAARVCDRQAGMGVLKAHNRQEESQGNGDSPTGANHVQNEGFVAGQQGQGGRMTSGSQDC